MTARNGERDDRPPDDRRRRFLLYAALAVIGGGGVAGAWAVSRPDSPPEPSEPPVSTSTPTESPSATDPDESTGAVPPVVKRYAPDLYFGAREKWYPTDPRNYVTESADGPVVDGVTALEKYSAAFDETETPPDPRVFYNIVEAADGVDAIQYWFYSVFDQFTVNFHWHDWELLQVFIDRETGSPLLLSASAHSRAIPNNEFLEPEVPESRRPGILSEVGSHSSASEINDVVPSFERLSTDNWDSDVTNDLLDVTLNVAAPFAYGLPRDEGARLPFVMPELDGERLDHHPSLSVNREDFIDESVTVESWQGLPRPPADLPLREPGLVMAHADSPTEADATYTLESIGDVRDAVEGFVGPQLSFEFVIPGFLENQFADHITSVGIPWEQDRFTDPLDDVTDPGHRQRIGGEAPPGLSDRVVGQVRYLGSGSSGALGRVTDEARDALEDAVSVSLYEPPVEVAVRLASEDPIATVTRDGVFGYLHVDPGDHLLIVNGPGLAPLAERFVHEGGLVRAGADGELTLVATEDVGWIRGDGRETNGIAHVRVIEDYAGVVYDGRPVEDDRFAVAVHRDGRYTVEITDNNGRPGAYRVDPETFDDDFEAIREAVETGKAALASTLRDEIADLRTLARTLTEQDEDGSEVLDRLSSAQEEAAAATNSADRGDARSANEGLSNAVSFLEEALELLSSERQQGYDDAAVAALEPGIHRAIKRAQTAIDTELA
ncbi:hypothetical protein ACERIT_03865 [Halopenitus sp. H-Gu1]|uniref:hypothetical protein n=1 Tax=Halopenitus sp. H-Gu1 TaxID=3242697 RepID=UPI00359EF174